MKIVTAEQMKQLDERAVKSGISTVTLIERAGHGVADIICRDYAKRGDKVAILVGSGNNGGDGLVAARVLRERGYDVAVLPISLVADASSLNEALVKLDQSDLIVDGLFGTGLSRPLVGPVAQLIQQINGLKKPVVAIDIPSGLDATTGMPFGISIQAHATITLGLPKIGLFCGQGIERSGRLSVVDIGIPAEAIEVLSTPWEMITPHSFAPLLTPRQRTAHKGDFGHVVVFAGSREKLGAGYLTSLGVLRAGAGLVTFVLPASSFEKFDARYPEIMCASIPDARSGSFHPSGIADVEGLLSQKNIVICGPAIGTLPATKEFVKELIRRSLLPLVLDADALNCMADDQHFLATPSKPIVITPHPGEMGRLVGKHSSDIQVDRINTASSFAVAHGVHVVLKGAGTIVATPEGKIFINPTGNPGMASAGMGDLLAGIIAGLMARHPEAMLQALLAAVYLHGLAGDIAARQGEVGLIASDVLAHLPQAVEEARRSLS